MKNIILAEGLFVSQIIYTILSQDEALYTKLKEIDEYLIIGVMQNCREEGYSYRIALGENSFTWCTYQHRNSDNIIINGKKGYISVAGQLPYKSDDKYDYLHSFNYGEYHNAAKALSKEIQDFIENNKKTNICKKLNKLSKKNTI